MSVSLPLWKHTETWADRDPEFLSQLKTGYPRFFVSRKVQDLAKQLLGQIRKDTRQIVLSLFTSARYASMCKEYLQSKDKFHPESIYLFHVDFAGNVSTTTAQKVEQTYRCRESQYRYENLYGVVYSESMAHEAKAFWQHTGYGISSRCAEYWLEQAPFLRQNEKNTTPASLPLMEANVAKIILRNRIADSLSRASSKITHHHVFLYQTGMTAISSVVAAVGALQDHTPRRCKVVIFGYAVRLIIRSFTADSGSSQLDSCMWIP